MRHGKPALIELERLEFARGGRTVLDVAHLRIECAQLIMLRGANGSGKTTLLKVLAGLLVARSGILRGPGTVMAPRTAARYCRGRHIYLHQTAYLFDGTVEDNIAYGLDRRGLDRTAIRTEVASALAWADLAHLARRQARALSTGEQQRVALTRARVLAPALLLLDEITANMDADSRRHSCELVLDLRRLGSSVVFASHHEEPLSIAADVHLVIEGGRVRPLAVHAGSIVALHRETARPGARP